MNSHYNKLIDIAATLLLNRLSETKEDYSKSMPTRVLHQIKPHNEKLRLMAIEIRDLADAISGLHNE